jgi:hypothetical protein
MARLTAGSHFANKRARAVGYIDVRENIDAVIGARRLDLDVVKLDPRLASSFIDPGTFSIC